MATRNVRSKIKNMQQNMGEFDQANKQSTPNGAAFNSHRTTTEPSAKGDYIDFEEIK